MNRAAPQGSRWPTIRLEAEYHRVSSKLSQADAAADPRQAPSASAKESTSTGANAMLGLLWIVTCLLIGEALVLWTGLPVPGAVMGVFVMFLCPGAIGRVSECIPGTAIGG